MNTTSRSARKSQRIYLDNTKLEAYRKCPRFYYLRHVRGWAPDETRRPLIFGGAWHSAMEVVWQHHAKLDDSALLNLAYQAFMEKWIEDGGPAEMDLVTQEAWEPRTPAIAAEMLMNYIRDRRPMISRMKLLSNEQPFAVPIFDDRDDVWLIGKKDKRILHMNRNETILIEHKTTTEYKVDGGFKASFVESFSPNSQLESYLYADMTGEKKGAKEIWVDAALVHKKVHDKFKFIPISYATEAMEAFLWETRDWASRILSEQERYESRDHAKATHMTAFPKNTWACHGRFGACDFLSVCRSIPNPDKQKQPPKGFKLEFWEPFDTLGLDKIMKR